LIHGFRITVKAELWTDSPLIKEKYAEYPITGNRIVNKQKFNVMLLNRAYSGASLRFEPGVPNVVKPISPMILKTRYELRLKVNGKYLNNKLARPYLINLHPGFTKEGARKQRITGNMRFDKDGNAFLEYDRKIELPFARVKTSLSKGKIRQ
jgi:hypothetical protein